MTDMKATIIETSGKLFKEKGYEQVTINEICQKCHITKTTFYYHISSKQDLLLQFYDYVVDNLTPILLQMIHSSTNWDQMLLLFNHLISSFESLGPELNGQLLIINLQRNEQALNIRKNLEEIAVDIIASGQGNGQFRNKNKAVDLFEAAAYMFTGYEYLWCVKKGEFDWRKQFLNSLETLLDVNPELRIGNSDC